MFSYFLIFLDHPQNINVNIFKIYSQDNSVVAFRGVERPAVLYLNLVQKLLVACPVHVVNIKRRKIMAGVAQTNIFCVPCEDPHAFCDRVQNISRYLHFLRVQIVQYICGRHVGRQTTHDLTKKL